MNQTAHISLQKLSISKSVETKVTGCALTSLARPASNTSDIFSLSLLSASLLRSVWRPALRVCVADEGGFTVSG